MKPSTALFALGLALTVSVDPVDAAEVYPEARPLDTAAFQAYVTDALGFALNAHGADAPPEQTLHGHPHLLQADWSTARVRVYRSALTGDGAAPTVSYVIAVRGARVTGPDDWGNLLRDVQAGAFPVEGIDPLVPDALGDSPDRVAWGPNRIVFDYIVGGGVTDAWAQGTPAATGLLDDLRHTLDAGGRAEVVVTGHGVGGAAGRLLARSLDRAFGESHPAAPLHIRSFAFAAPPVFGAGAASAFARTLATPDEHGRWRLQAYSITRDDDIVVTAGMTAGRPLHPAVWSAGSDETVIGAGLEAEAGVDLEYCAHLRLAARSRTRLFDNHDPRALAADLADLDGWRDAAECMAQPDAGLEAPGFKTFWGPGGAAGGRPVGTGEHVALRSVHGTYLAASGRGDRIEAKDDVIQADSRFELRDPAGQQATIGLGAPSSLFGAEAAFVRIERDGRLKADADRVGDETTFALIGVDGATEGPVRCGAVVAVRTPEGLVAIDRDGRVQAQEDAEGESVQLTVVCVEDEGR